MRYAAKGVFKFETVFLDPARPPKVFYETRIINFEAPDDEEATRQALATFSADVWVAEGLTEEIARQEQSFVGISKVRDLEPLDAHEVWYEYTDDCPPVLEDVKP